MSAVRAAFVLAVAFGADAAPTGLLDEQVFDRYADVATLEVIAERMFATPERRVQLAAAAERWLARVIAAPDNPAVEALDAPVVLAGHSVDLAIERFDVFVPRTMPESGYALLVFIPPTTQLRIPVDWRSVLNARGVIVVAPRNAGNGHPTALRRIPLALHARENISHRYQVDPARTYVGGWSGGARVAQAVVTAYPDLFRGALLVAGSDPVGDGGAGIPAGRRVVLLTGDADRPAWRRDSDTLRALRAAGVDATLVRMRNTGHVLPDGRRLAEALAHLDP